MYKVLVLTLISMISMQAHCFIDEDCWTEEADVVFVLDSSSSIWYPDFKKQLEFLNYFIDNVDVGIGKNQVRVGVVTFSTTAVPNIYLSDFNDKLALMKSVSNIAQLKGNTNTSLALDLLTSTMFTTEMGARKNVKHVAFILTDGSSQQAKQTQLAALKSRNANIKLFAIGIGNETNEVELRGIASKPKESHYFHVDNYTALIDSKYEIFLSSCQSDPQNIETECKNISADVFFLLDSSSSIVADEFKMELNAVENIIKNYDIGPDKIRIGLSIFSNKYKQVIDFNDGIKKSVIREKIRNTNYIGGGTKIGYSLQKIRTEIFTAENKILGRTRILIILTDGRTEDHKETIKESNKLKQDGVIIFSVGVGSLVSQVDMNEMASSPKDEYVFTFSDMYDLSRKVKYINNATCTKVNQPKDEKYCKPVDVIFAVNNIHLGHKTTTYILNVVNDVTEKVYSRVNFRFGIVFEQCPVIQDISFGFEGNNLKVQQQISKYQNKPFHTIIDKLSNYDYSNYLNRRVNFVFVDETINFESSTLARRIEDLATKNIKVYFVAIGGKRNDYLEKLQGLSSSHIIFIPSYKVLLPKLEKEIFQLLCPETAERGTIS